ncbi:MAG: hypothetical protein HKN92_12075 [Chitinophagales bacterium]|nr:hypothetical protein [Chitinophagales bacterium]
MGSVNKYITYLSLTFATVILTMNGCAFEEGPVSFRSASKRIENIWVYNKVLENGVDITFSKADQTIDMGSDGEVIIIASFSNTILQGTWTFNDHTDRILLDLTETSSAAGIRIQAEWIIKRLSKDEMFVEEYTDNKKYRYELVPKQ